MKPVNIAKIEENFNEEKLIFVKSVIYGVRICHEGRHHLQLISARLAKESA